jgi:hypothetical protein
VKVPFVLNTTLPPPDVVAVQVPVATAVAVAFVGPQCVIAALNSESSVPRCSTPSAVSVTLMPTLPVDV